MLLSPEDWCCILDGDTAFLRSDFGQVIPQYVEKYPDTGMFTCYASRCHYQFQVPAGIDMSIDSIIYNKAVADRMHEQHHLQVKEVERRIAGHMMLIKKDTWMRIRESARKKATGKKILGVDTKITYAMLEAGYKIRLMRGIYLFHYLRMKEGFNFKGHLE